MEEGLNHDLICPICVQGETEIAEDEFVIWVGCKICGHYNIKAWKVDQRLVAPSQLKQKESKIRKMFSLFHRND